MNRRFVIFLILILPLYFQAEKKALAEYTLSSKELQKSLADIEKVIQKGSFLDAQSQLNVLLEHKLPKKEHHAVQAKLEDVNMKILFSKTTTPSSFFYEVKKGDSLFEIAKKHNTTVDLIKRANGLKSDVIQLGQKLKIEKTEFSIKVDKSDNKLWLYGDKKLMKTYRVATGRDNSTPVGTFTIETKVENPTWYTDGKVVPPESPQNILGTRWLGFSIKEYGIHGTTLPNTIGEQASHGCVRMFNHEVEELYSIVPLKTNVTIRD